MSLVAVSGLSVRFPVFGVDERSLKKQIARITVGGALGRSPLGAGHVVTALEDINLHLRPGDRLGLIGPNGAGKTTLLRCLAGAYEPDEGRIEIHGRVAALLDLGLGLDTHATGLENIRLRAMLAGMSPREIGERIDSIGQFSGLGRYLALPMKTYSAGMTARLAFAVATSVDADVLLLDEWLSVGDSDFRATAHQRLVDMVGRAQIVVLASHDLGMVESYCNKVLRMDGGHAGKVVGIEQLHNLAADLAA
jgi:lipopolysaccharide transport system ATP-binding protein